MIESSKGFKYWRIIEIGCGLTLKCGAQNDEEKHQRSLFGDSNWSVQQYLLLTTQMNTRKREHEKCCLTKHQTNLITGQESSEYRLFAVT